MFKKSILVMTTLLLSAKIQAQIPQLINYQGILTDAVGTGINGNRTIEFRIYNSPTGGASVWSEIQTVTIVDGLFSVLLGSITPVPYTVFDGSHKYLALKIGSDAEMSPRKRLVSVGYAFHSYDSDKIDGKDAAAFVQKIAGVSSDNIGNIDLVAGANVTITPDNNNSRITISASDGGGNSNISKINAGNGLTGGGTSGEVTLDVGVGNGLIVSSDAVSLNTAFTDNRYVNEGKTTALPMV